MMHRLHVQIALVAWLTTSCIGTACTPGACGKEPKCPEGTVLIPGGTFVMGTDEEDTLSRLPNRPAHEVTISRAFCMDRTEVTHKAYYDCFARGPCTKAKGRKEGDPVVSREFPNWPMDYVSWFDAKAYCEDRGGRLPTEAEWEYAARGTDGRIYPWGNEPPTAAHWQARANDKKSTKRTVDVGTHPAGRSFFGLDDMAGNLHEWVGDACGRYLAGPQTDPVAAEIQYENYARGCRVVRGGPG